MHSEGTGNQALDLDDFIRAYEVVCARGERVDLRAFLPEPGHPLYIAVLCEAVRIELESNWDRGRPRPLEEYRSSFPELFHDRESLNAIAFEEYRLRLQAGDAAIPADYEHRFGVDVTAWPIPIPPGVDVDPAGPQADPEDADPLLGSLLLVEAALAYRERSSGPRTGGPSDPPPTAPRGIRNTPRSSMSCTAPILPSRTSWRRP